MEILVRKNPKNYWTKERCKEEALKYKTRSEFTKGSNSAYCKAWDNKWLDDICNHMTTIGNHYNRCIYSYEFEDGFVYVGLTYNIEERKKQHDKRGPVKQHILNTCNIPIFKILTDYIPTELAIIKEREFLDSYINNNWNILNSVKTGALGGGKIKWSKERCMEEALKYNDVKSYKNNSLSYRAATRNKWLDDICIHMNRTKKPINYWTKEKCLEISSKYKYFKDFRLNNSGAYSFCIKNNYLDDVTLHLIKKTNKPKGYWTKERCREEALKYNKRSHFQKNSISAYQISINNMWLDDICEHMK